jgi:hypothetical protein
METLKLLATLVIGTVLGFVIIGGLWYVVLWSFNFPIAFAWKQVIGIVVLTGLFGSYACMKD